jgi:DHA2 family multidrug resistance protein
MAVETASREVNVAEPLLGGSKLLITLGTMAAGLMAFLDISIVNVALNDIRATFGTPLEQIAWVSTSYAMANMTVIPLSGWLLKRFGFRRYYSWSIAVFTTSSVLCALAWDLPSLVVFRVLQGLGGGAIIPTSQSILFSRYPEKQHGMASALFGIGAITGPLLGPSVGGILIDLSSWHWIFLINLPIGLFSLFVASTQIEEPRFAADKTPIDAAGIALLATGMLALQYVLEEGNRHEWLESSLIVGLTAVAVVALVTFIWHELETDHPVVNLRVFMNRNYCAATTLNLVVGTALFAGAFLYALFLGSVMQYRASHIGMVFIRGAWIQLFVFPIVGKLAGRVDLRLLLLIANAGIFQSLWLNAHMTAGADMGALVDPLLMRALGVGFGFVPLTLLAVHSLPLAERPGGTALFNLTRELGASVGTAWMSTLLERNRHEAFMLVTRHVDASAFALQEQLALLRSGGHERLVDGDMGLMLLGLRIKEQALVRAFNSTFSTLAGVFAAATVLILLMKPPRRRAQDRKGTGIE